jgi:hypothetical protein
MSRPAAPKEWSQCADGDVHDNHTWGWPRRQCEGIRDGEERDMKMATKMARLFHDEEVARRQGHADLWADQHPLHLVLTWDVLPAHVREEKIEAMLQVFRWVNGQMLSTAAKYKHGTESPETVEPHQVAVQPHHRRPSRTRSW